VKIAGTYRAHQVPLRQPRDDEEEFLALELWFKSYKIHELLDESGAPAAALNLAIPPRELCMGFNKHTRTGVLDLTMPNSYALEVPSERQGGQSASVAEVCGKFFAEIVKLNPTTFRVFSPDELESNRMQALLSVTGRDFQWNEATANRGGRVIEMLSEHCCQGWMQGYTLTGRWAAFPSYETFLGIVTTMMIQYAKFLKVALETPWRQAVPGALYVESSTLWRQEHNGYSHQDPMFISNLLNMKHALIHVYLPPDANSVLACLEQCFTSKNAVNLIVCTKAPMPSYLTLDEARVHVKSGFSVVPWLSTDEGREPDIVLCGCGNETSVEVAEAAKLLRRDLPHLRVRVVNVVDVTMLDLARSQQCAVVDKFYEVFTADKPVIINWHGYPSAMRQLLFSRANETNRDMLILGYREEGTTTTPFKMLSLNHVDRFSVACEAIRLSGVKAPELAAFYQSLLSAHDEYILAYAKDPEWLNDVPRFKPHAMQQQQQAGAVQKEQQQEKASNIA
jgi:xylulose-5-phosphate/fructose-6-phosphate phosphoketolase